MKEREKEIFANKGITLVALIITIIVLLILAGVSLSFVFNGGILDKSQRAVNEYQNASEKEQDILDKIDKYLENEIGGGTGGAPTVPTVDENGLATENTTITTDDPNVQIVIPKGFAPVILQTGRTDSLPGENGAVKEIMPASDWNSITKEQINKGIVVVDNAITYDNGQTTGEVSDFNEYVWIPIADNSKFARVAWNGPYYADGLKIGTHTLSNDSAENKYWEETASSEYTRMISSVSLNKGFYISRYEASKNNDETAQSRRGQESWNYVSQLDAITASSNMKTSINSHLVYGIEWDSILQWVLDSGATIGSDASGTKTITKDDIQSDSRSWGNYSNSTGGAATNSGSSAKVGGTNEYWKVNNIYDLAGNLGECTQEKYSTGTKCAARGGNYVCIGENNPVAGRGYNDVKGTYDSERIPCRILCVNI